LNKIKKYFSKADKRTMLEASDYSYIHFFISIIISRKYTFNTTQKCWSLQFRQIYWRRKNKCASSCEKYKRIK